MTEEILNELTEEEIEEVIAYALMLKTQRSEEHQPDHPPKENP